MHELSITQHLLALALKHARERGAARVTAAHLAVGELSSFVDDAVRFCWEYMSADTPCAGAELHFRRVKAELNCLDCGANHEMGEGPAPCPSCGGSRLKISAGMDLILESLDLEIEDGGREERA